MIRRWAWRTVGAAPLGIALAIFSSSPSLAQDPAAFYKGKTVKFVVGFGTGGGFDAYARMIAPPLGKVLDANVIVENQPGAGGIIALNRIAASPPDGLTMMIVDGTPTALGQLLGQENVRYDLARLDHLGMISSTRYVWLVGVNSPSSRPPMSSNPASRCYGARLVRPMARRVVPPSPARRCASSAA